MAPPSSLNSTTEAESSQNKGNHDVTHSQPPTQTRNLLLPDSNDNSSTQNQLPQEDRMQPQMSTLENPNVIISQKVSSAGARMEGAFDFAAASSSTSSCSSVLLREMEELTSPSQLRSLSAVMDMEEVSCLLREQDADLLERHQSQTPNDATPQLIQAATRATQESVWIPDLQLTPSINISTNSSGAVNVPQQQQQQPQPYPLLPLQTSVEPHVAPALLRRRNSRIRSTGSEHSTSSHRSIGESSEEFSTRPTLAGQIYEQQDSVGELRLLDEVHNGSASSILLVIPKTDCSATLSDSFTGSGNPLNLSNAEAVAGQHSMDNVMRRSESMVRRRSEAVQFAEAVGDAKAAEQIKILEEDQTDDDDDDDDDDAQEEGNEEQPSPQPQETIVAAAAKCATSESVISQSSYENSVPCPTSTDPHRQRTYSGGVPATSGKKESVPDPSLSPFPRGRGLKSTSNRMPHAQQSKKKKKFGNGRGFLDQLPTGQNSGQSDYVYKGIRANPPEVVKRGIQRGNYAELHRKAWLEVSDKYHRYGKNLRFYYRHWEKLGCPTNMFFDWLDSKGEAAGQPLPEIEECPRAQLDADTVLYISDPEVTENYVLRLLPDENGRGRVLDMYGDPVLTGPDGWIFVLRDNFFYGAQKIINTTGRSKQRFHHSSFFGGKAVAAAGIFITDDDGYLTRLYPHSGHYRPREADMQRVMFFLHHEGVDLRSFDIDMQLILHVARDGKDVAKSSKQQKEEGGNNDPNVSADGKKKKVESLVLLPAVLAACFLAHKARFIGAGIFEQIHQIRKGNVATVREALDFIDDGGYW